MTEIVLSFYATNPGAHVLGALKHQFIDKHQNAFKRMVS